MSRIIKNLLSRSPASVLLCRWFDGQNDIGDADYMRSRSPGKRPFKCERMRLLFTDVEPIGKRLENDVRAAKHEREGFFR